MLSAILPFLKSIFRLVRQITAHNVTISGHAHDIQVKTMHQIWIIAVFDVLNVENNRCYSICTATYLTIVMGLEHSRFVDHAV